MTHADIIKWEVTNERSGLCRVMLEAYVDKEVAEKIHRAITLQDPQRENLTNTPQVPWPYKARIRLLEQ